MYTQEEMMALEEKERANLGMTYATEVCCAYGAAIDRLREALMDDPTEGKLKMVAFFFNQAFEGASALNGNLTMAADILGVDLSDLAPPPIVEGDKGLFHHAPGPTQEGGM